MPKVYLEKEDKTIEVKELLVSDILKSLKINPTTVLITKNNELILENKKLSKEEAHKKWLRTKERKIAYNKEWRKRNPKKNTEYVRRWEKKHLTIEQIREQRRKSYYRNRNKRLKQHADKYRNDPLWKELRIEREKQRYIRQSL